MYPRRTVEIALRLSAIGVLDREIAQICGASVGAHWRTVRRRNPASGAATYHSSRCPRCDDEPLDGATYAYLLGLYLGDGCITQGRRRVYALSVACCASWPGLIDAAQAAMSAVLRPRAAFG